MNSKRTEKSIIGSLSLAVALLASSAVASAAEDYAFMDEVNSCVAESLNRVDTTGASRVRHVVTDYRRSALGYAIKIETSVYGDGGQQDYSIYCVANGNHSPIKFRIKSQDS